ERKILLDTLEKEPEIAIQIIEILCNRLRWISQQVEDLGLLSIESRLASRLIFLYGKVADKSGRMKISQGELADFLGVTRESTNKVLQDWRVQGLIDITRGSIRVIDYDALVKIAET
ncbi:MAG: Crp/Fnr family transcriptional regulator, partial [Pseudomonadota bacterium]